MPTEKFKAMLHFIIDECGDAARLGAVRLNKICWYSDVFSYKQTGQPITQERYIKRQMGPVPADVLSAIRELQAEGAIAVSERDFVTYRRRDFMAIKPVDASLLSDFEQQAIRAVMNAICNGHSASSISELTHDQIWDAAALGEEIPLFATLAALPDEIDADMIEWANERVARVVVEREAA
jgi:hypothetical protein